MERFMKPSSAADTASGRMYSRWEEVSVSSDKGRREVHYYLKRRNDGGLDLAVVGKEKSLRHMSYHLAFNKNLPVTYPTAPSRKFRSRREVVDCLNSMVSGSSDNGGSLLKMGAFKDNQPRKMAQITKEFMWLGSAWTCRKRQKHYQSFLRNGVKVSVHAFVHVLAEEDRRLVAYLEDMYEDSRGNRMVVVRWFHKIDEVGFNLPHNYNDREIFFSLCLQHLSIECIDGLATVLSPRHFKKFVNDAMHTKLDLFVCNYLFEEEDIMPFDITQVQGYWKQEIVRYMYSLSPSKDQEDSQQPVNVLSVDEQAYEITNIRPKKRVCRSGDDNDNGHVDNKELTDGACWNMHHCNSSTSCKIETWKCSIKDESGAIMCGIELKQIPHHLKVGSAVEVLSQDSGIRGCWFRASVIKRHKDKVKVRYQDLKDAADEANQLEEWILASRVAPPDHLGIRVSGRTVVRPSPQTFKGRVSRAFEVGMAVDVWWHDAWWEGIVLRKESGDKFHVYFPGEKRVSVFSRMDLRHSLDWFEDKWADVKEWPDIASTIPSLHSDTKQIAEESNLAGASLCISQNSEKFDVANCDYTLDHGVGDQKEAATVPDLAKDDILGQLRWSSSKKRKRGSGNFKPKLYLNIDCSKCHISGSKKRGSFQFPTSLKVDHENCKYMGDVLPFTSAVVQPLTSLVMSR